MNKVHFSSKSPEWATPQDFFDELSKKFGPFDVDPCCTTENAKCLYAFPADRGIDGLTSLWSFRPGLKVFMNPPYGRGIGLWVEKAYRESLLGSRVVCLLPARTDTRWFHDYCARGRVIFIKGRLKFGGAKTSAPFPSMIVIFEAA